MKNISRRSFLSATAMGGMAITLPARLIAQNHVTSIPLRNDIHLISGGGCNVVAVVGPDSVLLVDGGLRELAGDVMQEVRNLAEGKPVATLFNTNWRPMRCGLNYELGLEGSTIIAHENTRLWQNNDFYVDWEDRQHHPMPESAQANQTFYKTGSLTLGSETVDYGRIGQFHTDGDIYVHFVESNVLITGDMMTVGTYPLMDYVTGGWIGGAQESTRGLLELADEDTLIIPAQGGVQHRPALEVQQQMLDHAFEMVADSYQNGRSLDQFAASAPMAEYDEIYGDPALFVKLLYRGAWYHVPPHDIPGII